MQNESHTVAIIVFASLMMFILGWAIILFVIFLRRRMIEKGMMVKQHEYEKEMLSFKAASEAQERERERIARNLHDEICLKLTIHKQVLESFSDEFENGEFDSEKYKNEIEKVNEIREAVDTCASDLVPAFLLKKGLTHTLEDLIVQLNSAGKVRAKFTSNIKKEELQFLTKHDVLNVYRICLELTNNIIKHAKPAILHLFVTTSNSFLCVKLAHDGVITTNEEMDLARKNSNGLGLNSINARIILLGATLNYNNNAGEATVVLQIPLSKNLVNKKNNFRKTFS